MEWVGWDGMDGLMDGCNGWDKNGWVVVYMDEWME